MHAYFDKVTGDLLAVHDRPEIAPPGAVAVPLRPGGEDVRRMVNAMERFRMIDGKVHEQKGWEPLDLLPDARWFATQQLDAAYAAKMAEPYRVNEKISVPYSAAQALMGLLALAGPMVKAGDGGQPVGADLPDGTKLSATWDDVLAHAETFAVGVGRIKSWYRAKLTEIEASADPLSVPLD